MALNFSGGSAMIFNAEIDQQKNPDAAVHRPERNRPLLAEELYCSGCPPGPGKAVIGVPSVPFPAITLFLNDCNVPPKLATPVTFCVMVEPAIRRVADAPAVAAPVLILRLISVLSTNA